MANIPNIVKRSRITKVGKDDGNYAVSQVDYLGKVCDVEILTPYGLYSNLPLDATTVLWNVQGQEENRVGIGNTPKTRFKNLKAGEVVVGSPQTLSNVAFKEDGSIVVTGKGNAVVTVDASGNISITTDGTLGISSTGNMTLHSNAKVILSGTAIELNGNAVGVARLGDSVTAGVISSASTTVKTGS